MFIYLHVRFNRSRRGSLPKERRATIFNRLRSKRNKVEIYFSLGAMWVLENPHGEKFPCFISTRKARMNYYISDFTTPTNKKRTL